MRAAEHEVCDEILSAALEALKDIYLEDGRVDPDALAILFRTGAALADQRANPAVLVALANEGFEQALRYSREQLSAFRAALLEGFLTRTAERLDHEACSFALRTTRLIALDANRRLLAIPDHVPLSWLPAFERWLDELEEQWMHSPVARLVVVWGDALDPVFADRLVDTLRAITALGTRVTLVPGGTHVREQCLRVGFHASFADTVLAPHSWWHRLFLRQ